MLGKGGEVVTRQPYRKVWLDHLLSKEWTVVLMDNCLAVCANAQTAGDRGFAKVKPQKCGA